jgi:hypothetical protein
VKKNTKIVLSACLTIAVTGVAFFLWAAFGDHSEMGVHRSRVDWLPATASDISFYRNTNISGVRVYEFRISRQDFEALAKEEGWAVKPFQEKKVVVRYTQCLPANHPDQKPPFYAESSTGLFFEERHANGGGISVLYDTGIGMAFVDRSNR